MTQKEVFRKKAKNSFADSVGKVIKNGRGHWLTDKQWQIKASPEFEKEYERVEKIEMKRINDKHKQKVLQAKVISDESQLKDRKIKK